MGVSPRIAKATALFLKLRNKRRGGAGFFSARSMSSKPLALASSMIFLPLSVPFFPYLKRFYILRIDHEFFFVLPLKPDRERDVFGGLIFFEVFVFHFFSWSNPSRVN